MRDVKLKALTSCVSMSALRAFNRSSEISTSVMSIIMLVLEPYISCLCLLLAKFEHGCSVKVEMLSWKKHLAKMALFRRSL